MPIDIRDHDKSGCSPQSGEVAGVKRARAWPSRACYTEHLAGVGAFGGSGQSLFGGPTADSAGM